MKQRELKTILVPVDGSKESISACVWAATIALATGARLDLLHVIDLNLKMTGLDRVTMSGYIPENFREEGEAVLQDFLRHLPRNVQVAALLRTGSPAPTIVKTAEERNPSWIIMGSRGRSSLGSMVMGSVSQYVLHHVSCPILIVKDESRDVLEDAPQP